MNLKQMKKLERQVLARPTDVLVDIDLLALVSWNGVSLIELAVEPDGLIVASVEFMDAPYADRELVMGEPCGDVPTAVESLTSEVVRAAENAKDSDLAFVRSEMARLRREASTSD